MVHELSRQDARRIAVRAQLLDAERPTDLLEVARRLAVVQVDLTAAVAPSADLVFWSRLGTAYSPDDLDDAVAGQRLVELQGYLRPGEDLALFRAAMDSWPGEGEVPAYRQSVAEWVEDNKGCRLDILETLRADGPLPVRDLPDTCDRPWRSSGWNNNRNVRMLVEIMEARGEVAVAGREGRDRLWDLAERIYPDGPAVPVEEAEAVRNRRRLEALGIARAKTTETPGEPNSVGPVGEEAVVEGVRGRWRVDPAQLDRLGEPFRGRTALLSPLDRLVFDRKRMVDLFDFDYQLEMYKPAARRRWGYFALPVLRGDQLVGKVDATADHERGVLRVDAVHDDVGLSRTAREEVDREIAALADWLGLEVARS
ncbi:winged helix DNA-binding domain-containing protein [Ornithinimicrobium sp. F0845]|uniref:DNA glycosylase AlkZ-like family protein n=1 Tax=Ornithinimicrobium sp. F0845 TaxID=2926412 RepID=UPI001FF56666|nr:crosslink repair DNA glycosylase YcaQ family protein [Ornithinimicrobium sp. F0845]MCK0112964.1 winged helix DNA-binding domain-containing protein [Ornithinimicrobium sp. F0845]